MAQRRLTGLNRFHCTDIYIISAAGVGCTTILIAILVILMKAHTAIFCHLPWAHKRLFLMGYFNEVNFNGHAFH